MVPLIPSLPNVEVLNSNLTLYNVYYVPTFRFNLISVAQLTKSSSSKLIFTHSSCEIHDLVSLRKIGNAKEHQGLYCFDYVPSSSVSQSCTVTNFPFRYNVAISHNLSKDLEGHYHFGHLSTPRLQLAKLVCPSIYIFLHRNTCTICPLGKQRKLPFWLSHSTSNACVDLIHVDIWGPFRKPTIHGHHYFLTIVDDHIKFTWIYLMKSKSKVKTIIPIYDQYVLTKFSDKLKVISSDNGAEFLMHSFYSMHDIINQVSCVETPEQNGIVERKHQHILNIARTLKFRSSIPMSFLGILHSSCSVFDQYHIYTSSSFKIYISDSLLEITFLY